MAHGGARPGAGRKVSSTTVRTRKVAEKLSEQEGISPLEVMVQTMRALWAEASKVTGIDLHKAKEACEIAQSCAPYMHPRLASVEQFVDAKVRQFAVSDKPLSDDEWARTYGALATPAGAAESTH